MMIPDRRDDIHFNTMAFPSKLYTLLQDAESHGFEDVISWQPGGKSFKVFQPEAFLDRKIMPAYFHQTKWESFQRQLNIYGWKQVPFGPNKGGYQHQSFIRGQPDLCESIVRHKAAKIIISKTEYASAGASSSSSLTIIPPRLPSRTSSQEEQSPSGVLGKKKDESTTSTSNMILSDDEVNTFYNFFYPAQKKKEKKAPPRQTALQEDHHALFSMDDSLFSIVPTASSSSSPSSVIIESKKNDSSSSTPPPPSYHYQQEEHQQHNNNSIILDGRGDEEMIEFDGFIALLDDFDSSCRNDTGGGGKEEEEHEPFFLPTTTTTSRDLVVRQEEDTMISKETTSCPGARTDAPSTAESCSSSSSCDDLSFPFKLHLMLDSSTQYQYSHIVSWVNQGTAFKVFDHDAFVEKVMPMFFDQSKYESFRRQLNLYQFHRQSKGGRGAADRGVISHPYLRANARHLCSKITRTIRRPAQHLVCTAEESSLNLHHL